MDAIKKKMEKLSNETSEAEVDIKKQAEETFVQESFVLDPNCPLRGHQSSQRGRGGEV